MIAISQIVRHVPSTRYSNAELVEANAPYLRAAEAAGVELPAFDESFLARLGVTHRHLYVDPAAPDLWWREAQGRFPVAREAAAAYARLMEGRPPLKATDRVIVISNTVDVPAPNMGYAMIAHLRRTHRDFVAPEVITLTGEGCSGYISGLREAEPFLYRHPQGRVVVVTAELMGSLLWHPDIGSHTVMTGDRQKIQGLAIQRLLFGDGCTASLVTANGDGHCFSTVARWDNLDADDLHLLETSHTGSQRGETIPPFGFFEQQPKRLMERLVNDYLPRVRRRLEALPERPERFAIHTGSFKILKLVQSGLGLLDAELVPSATVLRDYANMNSSTGPMVLSELSPEVPVFCLFFGVGFSVQMAC